MRKAILWLLSVSTSLPTVFAAPPIIAFERNDAAWLACLDGTDQKKIANGIFPAISPDATRIALTNVEKSGSSYVRHIAVVEIGSGKTTIFKDVPSENAYYPQWSPDGKRMLFTLRQNDVWNLATSAADGTDFRIIKKGAEQEVTLYSPVWAHDGGSIFCQDMTKIFQVGLDGSVLAQWKIDVVVPNGAMSGDGRISVSPDGKQLLLSIEMGEEHHRKDWDGPPPALWTFDIGTQKAVRVTPKSLFGWGGCWIDSDNVLFLSQAAGEKTASIYRMQISGKSEKRLIKNARLPTVSAIGSSGD